MKLPKMIKANTLRNPNQRSMIIMKKIITKAKNKSPKMKRKKLKLKNQLQKKRMKM